MRKALKKNQIVFDEIVQNAFQRTLISGQKLGADGFKVVQFGARFGKVIEQEEKQGIRQANAAAILGVAIKNQHLWFLRRNVSRIGFLPNPIEDLVLKHLWRRGWVGPSQSFFYNRWMDIGRQIRKFIPREFYDPGLGLFFLKKFGAGATATVSFAN